MTGIEKSPDSDFARKFDVVSQHIENLQSKYQANTPISAQDIEKIIPILKSCNESFGAKTIVLDSEVKNSIDHLKKALLNFPFTQMELNKLAEFSKSTQQKVASALSVFIQEINKLERNLKDIKIGRKVAKTGESSTNTRSG